MKASLLSKLETLSERHEEVSALLGDAEIIADQDRFRDLSREYAELENVVRCYDEFARVKGDLAEAELMLADDDPELQQMGRDELDSGGERLAERERAVGQDPVEVGRASGIDRLQRHRDHARCRGCRLAGTLDQPGVEA